MGGRLTFADSRGFHNQQLSFIVQGMPLKGNQVEYNLEFVDLEKQHNNYIKTIYFNKSNLVN
jgi:hypothetical protein